jgi:hypothetical protein
MKNFILIAVTCSLLGTSLCTGQVIHVPGDQPTIQAGINTALGGDTVLVADGLYYENISFLGKAITVASHFLVDGDTSHIFNTVIDGSQPEDPDFGSVVSFTYGEDTTSILCGFTITGGTGTYLNDPYAGEMRYGGGIAIMNSGAKIMNNHIAYNSLSYPGLTDGGGIDAGDILSNEWVVILNNKISHNEVISDAPSTLPYMCGSGGIGIYCNARVVGNEITHNMVTGNNIGAAGGGAVFSTMEGYPRQLFLYDNNISFNRVVSGSLNHRADAGGVVIYGEHPGVVAGNRISGNEISANYLCAGAGLKLTLTELSLSVENNIIDHNFYSSGEFAWGGGVIINGGAARLTGNLIYKNRAAQGGGVYIMLTNGCSVLTNNTIVADTAELEGGGLYVRDDACAEVVNGIIWDNVADEGEQVYVFSGTADISYSDIQGTAPWPGESNINTYPSFSDPEADDYCLWDDSPCIDAGNPDTTGLFLPEQDISGNPRIWNTVVDMGACEWRLLDDIRDIFGKGKLILACYPNPFGSRVYLTLKLKEETHVVVEITDFTGKWLGTVLDREIPAGNTVIPYNTGHLAPGIYIGQVTAGNETATIKMIKMK